MAVEGQLSCIKQKKSHAKQQQRLLWDRVSAITDGLEDYWPLTLRQIYYQLVAAQYIDNNQGQYNMLSKQLTKMRNQGELSWAVMEDRTRSAVEKRRWTNKEEYIRQQFNTFLKEYQRCLIQQQENHVELWVEKDALSRIFQKVAIPYCITIVTCKGHLSTTFLHNYADRAGEAEFNCKDSIIIYGGDMDPSGIAIPDSIQNRLWSNYGLDVEIDRFALTTEQIQEHNLPHSKDAIKETDPNYDKYVQWYGEVAVELDALHSKVMEQLIEDALHRHLDMESIAEEVKLQKKELAELATLRRKMIKSAEDNGVRVPRESQQK